MSGADDVDGWGSLIFSDRDWYRVTETMEDETVDKGGTTVFMKSGLNLYGSFSTDFRINSDPENSIRKHF